LRLLEKLLLLSDALRQQARARRLSPAAALGREAEDIAHRYLQREGYYIVARNFRTPGGSAEVDLVARHGDLLVFVEVKARESDHFGAPDRNLSPSKQLHMIRAARYYLRHARHDPALTRFDLISVVLAAGRAEIYHSKAVFSPS
jgi:putative endonuclease